MKNENSLSINDSVKLAVTNFMMQINGLDVAFPYFQGAPGGGKTACLQGLEKGLEFMKKIYSCKVISTHFALKPLEETGGIPQFEYITINGEKKLGTIWSFPDIMKELYILSESQKDNEGVVIWLLDDMHLCSPAHMAMLYELLTERKLREFKIPDNVAICLAGNTSNKAGAKTMFSAIINRVWLCPVHTDFEIWKTEFAIKNNFHIGIQSFLGNEMYQQFFHEEEQVDVAWGSPRSWTRFSNMLKIMEEMNDNKHIPNNELLYICAGHVGKTAASEFVTFYEIFNRFNVREILLNINSYKLPQTNMDLYALAFAGVNYYINKHKDKNIVKQFSKFVIKFGKNHPELCVMIMKEIIATEKLLNMRSLYLKISRIIEEKEPDMFENILSKIIDMSKKENNVTK